MGNASNSDLSQFRIHGTRHLNELSVGSLFVVDSSPVVAVAVVAVAVVGSNFAVAVAVVVDSIELVLVEG